MTDGEEAQSLARVCGDLRKRAKSDLDRALREAGASPDSSEEACTEIAAILGIFLIESAAGRKPLDEIGRVRDALEKLEAELSSLSMQADGWLCWRLGNKGWQTLQRFRDALPIIVALLPARPTKKGRHDGRLQLAVQSAAVAWKAATGRFPATTKTAAGEGTSPLLAFLQRELGNDLLSADSFRRAMKKLKDASPLQSP
jgi:hypothetical protein